jgi:hypothetical protein
MIDMRKVKLDRKTSLSIASVSILLGINSFNLILDKLIQILVTVEIFALNNTTSIIFYWYSEFCWLWLDILTLVNGLFFMLLFKNVALK